MNRAKWICEWYKVSSDSVSELGGGMTRRCSLCSNNGHNSRTCPTRSVKLFGVRMSLTDGSFIKKSASMSNLSSSSATATAASPSSDGYSSDHPSLPSSSRQKKKGVPWTEEEHRMFLIGLQKLGKGDWRGIASNFVVSRSPTQVASHAQKYFIRQSNATRRKRRSSLFDLPPDMVSNPPSMPEVLLPPSENSQPTNAESQPSLNLSLKSEFEPMETTQENVEDPNETMMASNGMTPVPPGFFPTYSPLPFSIWPSNAASCEEVNGAETSYHQVLKPIPVIPKEPVNVDEFVGISQLSIGETGETRVRDKEPSPLSLKLLGEPSRQSAFHAKTPVGDSDLNNGKNNVIQAG